MSRLVSHTIPYLIVGLLCFLMGYWQGSGQQPVIPAPVRQFISPDMFQTRVPQLRSVPTLAFIHTERTDTVTRVDTVRVPVNYEYVGLIEHRPLSVTPGSVYLNYYDTGQGRMVTDVYEVPKRRWSIDYGVQSRVVPAGWDRASAGVFTQLRYRSLSLTGEVDYLLDQSTFISKIGVRLHL